MQEHLELPAGVKKCVLPPMTMQDPASVALTFGRVAFSPIRDGAANSSLGHSAVQRHRITVRENDLSMPVQFLFRSEL